MLRNIAEEQRSHSQGDGSLKSIRQVICVMRWENKRYYSNSERRKRKLLHTMALRFGKLPAWLAVYPAPDNTSPSRRMKWPGTVPYRWQSRLLCPLSGGNGTSDSGQKCHTASELHISVHWVGHPVLLCVVPVASKKVVASTVNMLVMKRRWPHTETWLT